MNKKVLINWLVRIGSVSFVAAVIGGISVQDSLHNQSNRAQANLSTYKDPSASNPESLNSTSQFEETNPYQKGGTDRKERKHSKRYSHEEHEDHDKAESHEHDGVDDDDHYEDDRDHDEDDWFWEIIPGNDFQTDTRTKAS